MWGVILPFHFVVAVWRTSNTMWDLLYSGEVITSSPMQSGNIKSGVVNTCELHFHWSVIIDRLEGILVNICIWVWCGNRDKVGVVNFEACKTKLSCHLNWPCVGLASTIKCSLWGIDGCPHLFKDTYNAFTKSIFKIYIVASVLSIKFFSLENSGKMLGPCKIGVFWLRLGVALIGPCFPKFIDGLVSLKLILSVYPS